MLNAVLASLGVPLVVRRTVAAGKPVKEGKGPDKRTISNLELSVHRSSALCEELFGGPAGTGDRRLWGADGMDNWELQVCMCQTSRSGPAIEPCWSHRTFCLLPSCDMYSQNT